MNNITFGQAKGECKRWYAYIERQKEMNKIKLEITGLIVTIHKTANLKSAKISRKSCKSQETSRHIDFRGKPPVKTYGKISQELELCEISKGD